MREWLSGIGRKSTGATERVPWEATDLVRCPMINRYPCRQLNISEAKYNMNMEGGSWPTLSAVPFCVSRRESEYLSCALNKNLTTLHLHDFFLSR